MADSKVKQFIQGLGAPELTAEEIGINYGKRYAKTDWICIEPIEYKIFCFYYCFAGRCRY